MRLDIYKGFNIEFLNKLTGRPLVDGDVTSKIDVLSFDRGTRKQLERGLIDLDESDVVWTSYQEYSLIKRRVDEAIAEDNLEVVIYRNNLLPEYYPIEFRINDDLALEIQKVTEGEDTGTQSEDCTKFLSVYNALINVDGIYYGSFYNYEYEHVEHLTVIDYYPSGIINEDFFETEFQIYLNEDIEAYLRDLAKVASALPRTVGIRSTGRDVSKRILDSFLAYCRLHHIEVYKYHEVLKEDAEQEAELMQIAREDIGIREFTSFRNILFYRNPDIDKEIIEISQETIIKEIIRQAEKSYEDENGKSFKDIFITASTGAGKSIMFQIPAVYLGKKFGKLTIIIEPVKALMQDQKEKLNKSGFTRVEVFNSDLITQVEREEVLKRVKGGEVDLLYLSPETLLSYSIDTIIGDREIGLMIVDEAHIVTTWGMGFRPDYWYLGVYINRLRHQIQSGRNTRRKIYNFPICAFTATAINGGIDDSVSETIISLYMENPIKYIGYIKREDIKFQINIRSDKNLPQNEYEARKTTDLDVHLRHWLSKNEKTIVYFPYASLVRNAHLGVISFAGITTSKNIGTYTGRNIFDLGIEYFNAQKRDTFEKFRTGETPVIYATKAFGMGIDVDDIENVYHYAETGNLSDYVQEIGRAARKKSMTGYAITDFYNNDLSFMNTLFGMSQIRQYQIKKVLEGIYETHKNKNFPRNFLISPESFTYIFNGDEDTCINKLKTCLLMLEKDLYDKYNYKILISRPQSVFTKAFVVIQRSHLQDVLGSKYGECFKFIKKGRFRELQKDGSLLSDTGDVYAIDLKKIWEDFHPNISFPQFKYFYFNKQAANDENVQIMPGIRDYFSPRQKVTIKPTNDYQLSDIRNMILDDFEFVANELYEKYRKKYFTVDDFMKLLKERYGTEKSRLISSSLFDLVDPNSSCIKHRANEAISKTEYYLANGNFKEYMRKSITRAKIVSNFSNSASSSYESYMSLSRNDYSAVSLKLLSLFGYITYDIVGGEEPEIFIRLNDANKIRNIVMGHVPYSNNYVTQAREKHDRDVKILYKFFTGLKTDEERWDYIESYFLGDDVLSSQQI